jgi:uncharacterized protein YbcV (DUF1398 family)
MLIFFRSDMKNKLSFIFKQAIFAFQTILAQPFISEKKQAGYFPFISDPSSVSIYTDINDYALIQKSASLLQNDIKNVAVKNVPVIHEIPTSKNH